MIRPISPFHDFNAKKKLVIGKNLIINFQLEWSWIILILDFSPYLLWAFHQMN